MEQQDQQTQTDMVSVKQISEATHVPDRVIHYLQQPGYYRFDPTFPVRFISNGGKAYQYFWDRTEINNWLEKNKERLEKTLRGRTWKLNTNSIPPQKQLCFGRELKPEMLQRDLYQLALFQQYLEKETMKKEPVVDIVVEPTTKEETLDLNIKIEQMLSSIRSLENSYLSLSQTVLTQKAKINELEENLSSFAWNQVKPSFGRSPNFGSKLYNSTLSTLTKEDIDKAIEEHGLFWYETDKVSSFTLDTAYAHIQRLVNEEYETVVYTSHPPAIQFSLGKIIIYVFKRNQAIKIRLMIEQAFFGAEHLDLGARLNPLFDKIRSIYQLSYSLWTIHSTPEVLIRYLVLEYFNKRGHKLIPSLYLPEIQTFGDLFARPDLLGLALGTIEFDRLFNFLNVIHENPSPSMRWPGEEASSVYSNSIPRFATPTPEKDYSKYTKVKLVSRIRELEEQLQKTSEKNPNVVDFKKYADR